ncbi:glycine zipper domain-containing protein [Vitreimonas flagellata]|uniref:glycine zipper domain-containing protein n=1 Tax=Vitreimonas flagellata TaxID=2560861 RepID=UPI003B82DA72
MARSGHRASGLLIGAFVGGPYGALVGGLVGAAKGEPWGEAMRERVMQDPICAASLTGCLP